MSWSIQEVARASGVTARTLRYYAEIGLLEPARIGANAYRYYEQGQGVIGVVSLESRHVLAWRSGEERA